jgi:hypothetical protein
MNLRNSGRSAEWGLSPSSPSETVEIDMDHYDRESEIAITTAPR